MDQKTAETFDAISKVISESGLDKLTGGFKHGRWYRLNGRSGYIEGPRKRRPGGWLYVRDAGITYTYRCKDVGEAEQYLLEWLTFGTKP